VFPVLTVRGYVAALHACHESHSRLGTVIIYCHAPSNATGPTGGETVFPCLLPDGGSGTAMARQRARLCTEAGNAPPFGRVTSYGHEHDPFRLWALSRSICAWAHTAAAAAAAEGGEMAERAGLTVRPEVGRAIMFRTGADAEPRCVRSTESGVS
jgi:hypothetical protein